MDSKESETGTTNSDPGILNWKGPHSVVIPRTESGFGFTLRHFVVYPPQSVLDDSKSEHDDDYELKESHRHPRFGSEGRLEPQDIRLEPQDTIFVKSVKTGSPAHLAGLNTGDRVVAVNGDSVTGKSYSQVISLIQDSTKTLKLLVVPKDEDILQMAYQSEVVGETIFSSNTSLSEVTTDNSFQQHHPSHTSQPFPHHQRSSRLFGKHRSLSCEQAEAIHQTSNQSVVSPSRKTLTSFHHNSKSFSSQDSSPSTSKMSIASNIPSKTKYSFGLYFPPKSTAQNTSSSSSISSSMSNSHSTNINNSRTVSTESLGLREAGDSGAMTSRPSDSGGTQRRSDPKFRKSSLDETSFKSPSSSARSRDYFIRYSTDKSNSDARNRYSLRHSTHERSASDTNKPTYIITRSQTVSSISPSHSVGSSNSAASSSSSSSSISRRSGDFSRRRGVGDELDCKTELTRQILSSPAVSSDSKSISGSRKKSDIHVSSYSREPSNTTNQKQPSTKATNSNSSSSSGGGTKTLVVRIPYDQHQPIVTISQARETTNQTPVRQSYGTAFALKRSPLATHIEIQKAIGKPIVSQRKSQFESKKEEPFQPARVTQPGNRYKMEIERIRTQPKFSSLASRKASFEQSPDRDFDEDGKEASPSSSEPSSDSPKPMVKIRKISSDSNSSATPPPSIQQHSGYRERSCTAPSSSNTAGTGSPICIYVTPGHGVSNSSNILKDQHYSSSPSSSSPSMVVSVIPSDKSNVKTSTGEPLNNLSSSPFQDDDSLFLHHKQQQRNHSSPSPSSLSTGTMGDSGVWVKSYHGSSDDMLDSSSSSFNPRSAATTGFSGSSSNSGFMAVTTTAIVSTGVSMPPSLSSEPHQEFGGAHVFPRQRHKSYLEAMNSPKGSQEVSQPSSGPQHTFRGVHTQSPQQMLAQSQAVSHVPSMSPSPSSTTLSPNTVPQLQDAKMVAGGSGEVHSYSPHHQQLHQHQPKSIGPHPGTNLVSATTSNTVVQGVHLQSSETKPYQHRPTHNHHHHHHPHQQQQQQQHLHPNHHHQQQVLFPGSPSSLSLGSIGDDAAQPGHCLASAVMSTSDSAVSISGSEGVSKSNESLSVTMRKKAQESLEDQANKLHRRTSYLMATAKDRTNTVPIEKAFSPQQPRQQNSVDKQEQQTGSSHQPSSVKLNKFFGEQIPSIAEGSESKSVDEEECTPPPTPPPEVIRKGPLSCKIAVMEGKKCSDRTWKTVYAILRQTEMFVAKDVSASASSSFESQIIPLKSCMVEFARDYAKKKKNVFRLTTHHECEYLFQAEDRGTMLCWIQAIKSINEPEKAEKMDEMIAHEQAKRAPVPVEVQVIPSNKLSPPLGHMAKKLSGLSLRSKLTASPNMRRKKSNASEKDKEKPDKDDSVKKSWKGRIPMMKNLKKHSEDSLVIPSLDIDPSVDCCKQFGMPIEDCFPSPYNEYVPLIVELCTRIVETRGLEIIGVYRVPGNSAAVSALVEEFNRGIDNVNIDNEKLLDINVISSLLKSFFRKLPEPLVNAESYDGFIEANRNPDADKRMLKLKRLLHLLPTHHNETFKHMAEHLNKVASYGNINKMDAKNLAIMFGPTLIRKSEDDTVSLVTDMSDQCRIIESIILHHDWFFSQWDQDSHIPMETKVETVLPDEGHGEKDDDEEADSAISTKEIISSIVGAASRKLRDQQQKSEDSLDSTCGMFPSTLSSQDGRSFYQETKATEEASRLASLSTSKSHNSLASSHGSCQILAAQDIRSGNITNSEPDFLDLEFADACNPTMSSPYSRHFSDESLLEKNDELEISHGLSTSMSRQTIHNTLKRIGNDVKTLLQTFEQKQLIEMERRRKEQEMIEHEHLRTQLEIEQEDSRSVEDWLAMRGGSGVISSQMPDLVSSSYIGESYPYNTQHSHYGHVLLSDGEGRPERVDRERRNLKPGSNYHQPHIPIVHTYQGSQDSALSKTSSCDDLLSSVSNHIHQESYSPQFASQIASQLPHKSGGPSLLSSSRQKNVHLAVDKQHLRPSSFRLSMGKRHGSLDSLINLIDKRSSWASTDSEDGSDLLTSLTTTFDQKLQILVNPKYKLTGTGSRKHYGNDLLKPATIVSDMKETAMWRSSGDPHRGKQQTLIAGPATLNPFPPSSVLDSERPFRDPSLHRSSKPEAKIGIASRFERNDNRSLASSPVLNVSDIGQRSPRKPALPDFGAFLNRHNNSQAPSISLTQPKKLEDNTIYVLRSLNKRTEPSRPITKSEKTEMNSNLVRLSREEKFVPMGDSEEGNSRQENKENKRRRRSERKQCHRRHTVGGTQDYEHIDALVQVCGSGEEESSVKLSAWDQLQPIVKDGGNRNLQSWLQKERTRGSTPDLSIGE